MEKRVLIMPIGIPGSGKTTWARKMWDEYQIPRVSSDDVREHLYGNASIQGDFNEVFDIVHTIIRSTLDQSEEDFCILDATNVTRWVRQSAIWEINPTEVIYVLMGNDVPVCKKRNAARDRVVPEYVIDNMYKKYCKNYPIIDELKKMEIPLHIFLHNEPALYEYIEEVRNG